MRGDLRYFWTSTAEPFLWVENTPRKRAGRRPVRFQQWESCSVKAIAMQVSQYPFEVVRDIATLLLRLDRGERITITVERHGNSDLLDWTSSVGTTCGLGETARWMQEAYEKPVIR